MVEGPKLVSEAVASGLAVRRVYVEEGHPLPAGVDSTDVATADVADIADVAVVAAGVLGPVLDTVTPQPVAAVVELPSVDLDEVVSLPGLVIVADGVGDPGNVGTIVRSLEAFGGAGLVLTAGSADPFGPKAVRSSAGSVLRVPVVDGAVVAAVVDACRRHGRPVLATAMAGGTLPEPSSLRAAAVVVGNEAHGVSAALADAADGVVSIPMAGPTESLNVAMAATILAHEASRAG